MKRSTGLILLGVAIVFGWFLFYPLAYVFRAAFFPGGRFSLAFFQTLASNPIMRQAIANSLVLAVTTTTLTAFLALPLAFCAVKYAFPAKGLLTGLLLVPMIMPPFVGAIGMRQFLARFGSINLLLLEAGLIQAPIDWLGAARFWGVVIVMVLHLYPIMYLNVVAALANVDPTLQEAAVNLGSNGWHTFRRITLPLMMPGLFAGSVIVFIGALTDLGTPLVFEYRRVIPVQIFDRVTDMSNNPEGYALVVFILLLSLTIFLLTKRLFGTKAYQTLGKGGARATERIPGRAGQALIVSLFLVVVLLASLPHLGVILTSVRRQWFMTVLPTEYTAQHYQNALGHPLTLSSIRNSIFLSSMSTLLDLVLGISLAYILVRRRIIGRDLLDAIVMLPLAVPGLVLAFGYVGSFAGTRLDPRNNPIPLLVLAYAMRRLPYVFRAAYAGFQQVGTSLEEAAVNLGSSGWRVLRRITLPLISANLLAGGILAFAFAMLEVSDSLILAIKERYFPLTKAIFQLLGRIEDGAYIASALGAWAMLFLALALITAGVLLGRRMGQLFRV